MRNQRRSGVTVELIKAKVTTDALGDETGTPVNVTVHGCQVDSDQSAERAGDDQVTVLRTIRLNIPGVHQLVADDSVRFYGSTWQVVGNGNVWRDRTKVRVQQARKR